MPVPSGSERSGRPPGPAVPGPLVACATHRAAPRATTDDRRLVDPLSVRCGARVEAVAWNCDDVDWTAYDAVLIRSTWDYHRELGRFLTWVDALEASGVAVWNPAAVVRWNASKSYLRDLEAAGVPVVPTEWIARGANADLPALLRRRGWERAVVKPSVGATAYRTWTTGPDERSVASTDATPGTGADGSRVDDGAKLRALLADADALVQPFLEPVIRRGEWSFMYFAGDDGALRYSHAVVKRPADGDFRVQDDYGGSAAPMAPPDRLRCQVDEAVAAVGRIAPAPILYARIDGVVSDGRHAPAGTFLLMEAELIEPVLFLEHAEDAADRFAAAIARGLAAVRREPR